MFGKVKKLKKIPADLVSYIQIETDAIKDANDKMMISSCCLGKLEMVNWYIDLLEAGSKKYSVSQSREYLEMIRNQLIECHKEIMKVKIKLLQHIPTAVTAGTMASAYTVSFSKGLPHTLVSLKRGGFGSQILENGRIAGSASFYQMSRQAAVLSAFTVMSVVTGQFFWQMKI